MSARTERCARLQQLLELSCIYRDWTRVRLARELGRDRSRLCPQNGDPKLSYLVKLSAILEWPLDTVIGFIRDGFSPPAPPIVDDDIDWASHYQQAYDLRVAGDYRSSIKHARLARVARAGPNEIARALNIEFTSWEAMGLYAPSVACLRDALAIRGTTDVLHMTLRVNLAIGLLGQGDLIGADALAESTIAWFHENMTVAHQPQIAKAFAHYAHASVHRRLAARYPERLREHMQRAAGEFAEAERLLTRLATQFDRQHLAGIANTCRGGRFEAEAVLGVQPADLICETMLREIDDALARPGPLGGDWLESYGWWTVGGGNIALRHLRGRDLQEALRRFTDQAIAIARQMDNWAFRERALSMEHALRHRISRATGFRLTASIEDDDVRWITGTIGRFPDFQQTGWEILQDARLVC